MSLDKPSPETTESSETTEPSEAASNAPSMWKDPLIWFILGIYFFSTSIMNFLPVTFPIFRRVFSATLEQMGRIQVCYYMSALVFTLGGGWFVGRFGYKRTIAIAMMVIASALVIIGTAQSYAMVLVGAFVFGLGVLPLAVTTASIIGELFGPIRQRLFFVHGMVGSSGSVVGPAGLGWFLGNVERLGQSWRTAYFATATVIGSLVLWPLFLRSKTLAGNRTDDKAAPGAGEAFKHILSQPAMWMIFLLTTFHGLTEAGMISFVGQLYQRRLGVDAAQAAYFLSSHAGGFLAGRALLSLITGRWKIPELVLLSACAAGGAVFFGATILGPTYLWGMVFMFVAGIFVSGNGPSINSYMGMRFQAYAKTAYAFMSGISYIGGALGPYLVGFLGSEYGLEKSMWVDPFFSFVLSGIALVWFFRDKSGKNWNATQASA